MDHRVSHFYSGWESVEDEAAGFLLEDVDEFAIGGEIVFVAEDGGREVAGERAGGAEVVRRRVAVDEESVGTEDLVGEMRFPDELIERDAEELGGGVEWSRGVLAVGEEVGFGCD